MGAGAPAAGHTVGCCRLVALLAWPGGGRDLLAGVTLGQYLATRPPRSVLSVAAGDPLGLVLRRFAAAGLVAAPLFADEQRSCYVGFIDLLDVVEAVVSAARHEPGTPSSSGGGSAHALRMRAAASAARLAAQPVGVIRATHRDEQLVYQAQMGETLLEASV